jgi:ribose 5-phosphate isomerase A
MEINPKQLTGGMAADLVGNDMVVGLGTGSTAFFAIKRLGERVRQGLNIRGIPTSEQSRIQAEEERIPLTDFSEVTAVDLTIDGADEVDPAFNLTKGGGGALLREKIVASASLSAIIVVDESKMKHRLGGFALPVEVVPFGWQYTSKRIQELGCEPRLRADGENAFQTDNGNFILDCPFGVIDNPPALERELLTICGVIECGLFTGLASRILIGRADGSVEDLTEPQVL